MVFAVKKQRNGRLLRKYARLVSHQSAQRRDALLRRASGRADAFTSSRVSGGSCFHTRAQVAFDFFRVAFRYPIDMNEPQKIFCPGGQLFVLAGGGAALSGSNAS